MTCRLFHQLRELQLGQLKHDQLAHSQVVSWPFERRVTHFVLHFAKYQATLLTTDPVRDLALRKRVLTDSLIISLAAANTLGIRLSDRGLNASDRATLLKSYIATVGTMAKACEAMDHGELFDVRQTLENAVLTITSLTAALGDLERIDLVASTYRRWAEVEDLVAVSGLANQLSSDKTTSVEYA